MFSTNHTTHYLCLHTSSYISSIFSSSLFIQMALNIAVPMSGVGDLLEGFGLLSPISPVSIDFRSSIKNPLSPVGSESSGVSSLDLEDIKVRHQGTINCRNE